MGERRNDAPWATGRVLRRLGALGFWLFFAKGMLWLAVLGVALLSARG